MGAVMGTVLGSALAAFGFAAMRDPMRWALLALSSAGAKGYYQRMVLDRSSRLQLRVLGALLSLFGSVIFTTTLGGLLKLQAFNVVSTALLLLMALLFFGACVFGFIHGIVLSIQGRSLDWLRLWRRSVELGPIDVYPTITPVMQRESRAFTVAFSCLVTIVIIAALFRE